MLTSESFRAKLRLDFQSAMKPSTGSKQTHISWFMPLGVFIDLFAAASEFHRTASLWVFKHIQEPLCQSLMEVDGTQRLLLVQMSSDAQFNKNHWFSGIT